MNPRTKPLVWAAAGLVILWVVAATGYAIARNAKVTADKVRAYLTNTELSKLSAADRAKALRRLAHYLNQLPPEERRLARMDREWERWFRDMTDEEKGQFIEATMPSGVKQMLTSFEQLPPDKRGRAVGDALKRLREARDDPSIRAQWQGAQAPPPMNEEMTKKMAAVGLNAFYTQSTAQTKAELAPLLEEIQRSMEGGRLFRGR